MTRIRGAVLGAALVAVAVIGVNVLPSSAHKKPPPVASEPPPVASEPEPIAVEPLTGRAVFTDDVDLKLKVKVEGGKRVVVKAKDPSRTFVARFTLQPGAQFPWHTHPGPVIVNVTQGELVYVDAEDCVERSYPAGTAFVDTGHGHVHTAYNPTDAPTVLVGTFFEAPPAPAPVLIPVDAPDDCEV